jgi:hypothetical protein
LEFENWVSHQKHVSMKNSTLSFKKWLVVTAGLLFMASGVSAATILSETFATSLGSFTPVSVKGDQVWYWSSYSGTGFAKVSGYTNVQNLNEDWLISPSMDFSDVQKANLSFQNCHKYGLYPTWNMSLWVTDSYTGGDIDSTKWTKFEFTYGTGKDYNFVSSGLIALDAYAGKENVRVAFRYKSDSTINDAATWEVKDVLVESVVDEPTPEATVVLSENFDGFTAGTIKSPSSTDISSSLDTYTQTKGWSGTKVYQAGGAVKLASSSAVGSLSTPAMDLSSNGGKFLVSFKASAWWPSDSKNVILSVNGVEAVTVPDLPNDSVLVAFGPIEVSGGTSQTVLTFSSFQAAKGRVFLDSLVISQVMKEDDTPVAALTGAAFDAEVGATVSKQLTLTGTNLTGDLTVALANTVGTAFNTKITTVPAADVIDSAGYELQVNYVPTAVGKDTAVITISGGGLAEAITATVTGSAWQAVEVADLTALRAAYDADPTDETTIYRVSGEAVMSFKHSSGNSKYFQDSKGGVLIYDTKGLITTELNEGDGVKNLTGTLDTYGSVMELIPVKNVTVNSTNNALTPVVLTIADYKANKDKYESMLIRLNQLTNISGKTAWGTSKSNFNFTDGTDTLVLRTNYTGLDYMTATTNIPEGAVNYVGLALEYNGTVQFFPRSLTDINVTTALPKRPAAQATLNVYGSNGQLTVVAKQGQVIEVYNVLGRKVTTVVAQEGNNILSLTPSQLYLVRVGKTTTKIVL